ncbi:hypothetical protein, partial [Mesorhizobium sp.]|uniref:hypothetical protein n=1 Tax=Mesorhizobium sp. TaxID=1871066 RepID=UPI00257D9D6E
FPPNDGLQIGDAPIGPRPFLVGRGLLFALNTRRMRFAGMKATAQRNGRFCRSRLFWFPMPRRRTACLSTVIVVVSRTQL